MKKEAYDTYDSVESLMPSGPGVGGTEYFFSRPIVSAGQEGIGGHPGALGGIPTRPIPGQSRRVDSFRKTPSKIRRSKVITKKANEKVLDRPQHSGDNLKLSPTEEIDMSLGKEASGTPSSSFLDELGKLYGPEVEKEAQIGAAIKAVAKKFLATGAGRAAKGEVARVGRAATRGRAAAMTAYQRGAGGKLRRAAGAAAAGGRGALRELGPGRAAAAGLGAGILATRGD